MRSNSLIAQSPRGRNLTITSTFDKLKRNYTQIQQSARNSTLSKFKDYFKKINTYDFTPQHFSKKIVLIAGQTMWNNLKNKDCIPTIYLPNTRESEQTKRKSIEALEDCIAYVTPKYFYALYEDFNSTDESNKYYFEVFDYDGNPVKCLCQHLTEERDREYENQYQHNISKKLEHLKLHSLLGEKYKNVNWNTTKTGINDSFDTAYNRCYKYSQNPEAIRKDGFGIYLWGDKGVGKTHLAAAITNSLLAKGIPVLFTNLFKISKSIKATYQRGATKTELDLINEFSNMSFLIFDDLGSEVFAKNQDDNWIQGILYDLINERYNSGKPTIFTSNYDLNELVSQRKIMNKTVDRIQEMTKGAVIKIKGQSLRKSTYGDKTPF